MPPEGTYGQSRDNVLEDNIFISAERPRLRARRSGAPTILVPGTPAATGTYTGTWREGM